MKHKTYTVDFPIIADEDRNVANFVRYDPSECL